MADGVFGSAEPVTETATDEADVYLGYTSGTPDANTSSPSREMPQEAQDGAESFDEGDSSSRRSSGGSGASGGVRADANDGEDERAHAWEQERAQYQQAIQTYEQTIAQLLQMFQTNPFAQQGPQLLPGQQPVPPFGQQPVVPFGPAPGVFTGVQRPVQQPFQGPYQDPSQQPAAPHVSDEELQEQFWQDPVKATRQLLDRWLQEQLLPLIQQREAYFGQIFGSQIMAPLVQQVAMVQDEIAWRDRVTREYQSLRSKHEDFDQVAPVIQQMLNEDPQRFVRLRQGQETLEKLYREAKKRVESQGRQLTSIHGGKGAARMPRAGAARVPSSADDNDALVEAALGPMDKGGIWG